MINFQALGTARLSGHDGNELHSILARPKLLGLLAYLAAAGPRGFVRRDTLVGVFWPDVEQERARRSLRQSLYHLRVSLGESAIVGRGDDEVGLNAAEFRCDLWSFDQSVGQEDREKALELYGGDFLEGFSLSGAREFEDWVGEQRRVHRETAAKCAISLADQPGDDRAQNAAWARLAIRLAPLDEGLVQAAIAALDRAGDRAGAVKAYLEFADRLVDELGVEPSPETRSLVESIRVRGPSDASLRVDEAAQTPVSPTDGSASTASHLPQRDRPSPIGGILFEVRRRRVARVAVAYCLVALATLEAADIIVPRLQLPDWSVSLILALIILGLPIVLALAWIFDFGPGGIVRTPPSSAADRVPSNSGWRSTTDVAITAATATLLVGAGAWMLLRNRGHRLDADRLLVAGLENQTGDPSLTTLGSIALDWLTRGLQQTGAVRVIDARMLAGDPLGYSAGGSPGLARALGVARERAVGTLLSGAYYKQGDSVYFQVQLTDVMTGELRHSLDPVSGSIDEPIEVIEELRQRVMSTLAALTDFDLQTIPVKPPLYDAYQEFLTGLILAAQGGSDAAIEHAFRAAALDTNFAAPLLLASGELLGRGDYGRADSLLSVVAQKRGRLSVLEQTALDGQVALLRGDLTAYVSAARRNDEFFGLNLDQVRGLLWLNRPQEAIEVLARIDTTDVLSGGRPGYWRLLHDAHHMLGQYERALDAGVRARAKYANDAGALQIDLPTLAALGRTGELEARLDELAGLAGRGELAIMDDMLEAIYELRAHGHTDASRAMLQRLSERLLNPGPDRSPGYRVRLAAVLCLEERWNQAGEQVEALLAAGDSNVEVLGLLGVISARRGDRESALGISAQLRDMDRRYMFGVNSMARARIAAALGEPDEAVALVRDALAGGYRHSLALHRDAYLEPLRDYPPYQELTRPRG